MFTVSLKRFREIEMSSPSHFLLRAGRVFCIPTRVGHPELIHLCIGCEVLVHICENLFTNYSSLLWCAVSGLCWQENYILPNATLKCHWKYFFLIPRDALLFDCHHLLTQQTLYFLLHVFSVLAYTGTSFPFHELLIIAI